MIGRLLKLVIAIFFYGGYHAYRLLCLLCRKPIPPALVIITYHPVKASQIGKFKKQMDMLLTIGCPVALKDIAHLKNRHNIAVTFDDAYQSVLENALPILQERNIPAAIFAPSGCLGQKPPWIGNRKHSYAEEIVMTREQLTALPANLITIGSHTVSHINLNQADINTIKLEAVDSKSALESLLNREITFFAAPYATFNEKHASVFMQAGYQKVFLNIPTFPTTQNELFILGRTSVEPTDWPIEFHLKLSGAYQWLPLAINLKKKMKHCNGL